MLFSCSPATILIGSHSMQWEVMCIWHSTSSRVVCLTHMGTSTISQPTSCVHTTPLNIPSMTHYESVIVEPSSHSGQQRKYNIPKTNLHNTNYCSILLFNCTVCTNARFESESVCTPYTNALHAVTNYCSAYIIIWLALYAQMPGSESTYVHSIQMHYMQSAAVDDNK